MYDCSGTPGKKSSEPLMKAADATTKRTSSTSVTHRGTPPSIHAAAIDRGFCASRNCEVVVDVDVWRVERDQPLKGCCRFLTECTIIAGVPARKFPAKTPLCAGGRSGRGVW